MLKRYKQIAWFLRHSCKNRRKEENSADSYALMSNKAADSGKSDVYPIS